MRRRLIVSYVTVAAAILLVLEIPLGIVYARHERDIASAGLQRDASAVAALAEEGVERRDNTGLDTLVAHYRHDGDDVQIYGPNGAVLVPAAADEGELTSSAVRARVQDVLAGREARGALGDGDELTAIAPIGSVVPPAGAVVVITPNARVHNRVRSAWMALGALAAAVLAAVALLGALVARSVTRPLTHLERAALSLGRGDLSARASGEGGPPEVRALSRAFNEMAERLEDLVSAQRAFVADASHQLRSPLTAARLRLENIAASLPGGEAADVETVLSEMDRLSRVVDGLLLLARSEGQRPEREIVDLDEIALERRDAWGALAEEAGIVLDVDVPDQAVTAWWVPGHVDQILDNLLANAVEATPAGRRVSITVRPGAQWAEIHVVDEGRGMGSEERRHAFDRFWRGAASTPGGGSGLGLAIVQQLARASGATVELREAPGGGIDAVVRSVPAHRRSPVPHLAR